MVIDPRQRDDDWSLKSKGRLYLLDPPHAPTYTFNAPTVGSGVGGGAEGGEEEEEEAATR